MTGSFPKKKPKFFTFVITLVGLYILTGWAGIGLLQPTPQPFFGTVGTGGAVPVIEWWQYILFGLYNIAVWVGAYFIAAIILPKFFS